MEPDPAPPAPPIVVAPPPPIVPTKTGLRDSIFEVSQTSGRDANSADADPTVAAGMALTDATDQAVISLGEGRRPPMETSADSVSGGTALSAAPPRLMPPPFADADRDTSGFVVGKVLSGRLEIVADLGGGPLGRVFKAIDRKKGSVVVVKAIAASRLPAAALSGRFAEVIQLVKGLTHPNLVRVHGAGRDGDTAFVIMQHLEGLPLRRLLDVKRENGGTFTFEEAEPIVVQICQGLQFAHASLVHGGLKPENVFVQVDSLKLIDTGFSRLFSPTEWREIQRQGKGAGAYLAPEYGIDGGRIDRRADVYSVGAILYEMLTGRPPVGPDSPAVSSLNPSVPRAVDRVVQKAMAASPENRYATAAEVKDAVLRVLGGDILADDLEAGAGDMGTFVDPAERPDDGPIEIEYVEAPPDLEPERKSDDATPVGAIELQEPLWEPDEIAETRASEPLRQPTEAINPRPGIAPAAIAPRGISKPRLEDMTATSAIRRPDMSVEQLLDTARGMGPDAAQRDGDKPSSERTSISSVSEDEAVDQSVDLGGDEVGATEAGFEPTTGSAGNEKGNEVPPPRGSWLDQPSELADDDGPSGLSPRVLAPVSARARADSERRDKPDMSLSEGSPLDLELDDPDAPPSNRPPVPPSADGPTIRRTAGAQPVDPPSRVPSVRRPTATPPPWDSRNDAPTSQLADRPTDPRGGKPSDRPTAAPRRYEDNPGVRALSSPPIQPLELTFSAIEEGPEGAPPVTRAQERPTADAPAPMVKAPVAIVVGAPRIAERPTLTGGPRPAFVARRKPSKLPLIIVFLLFAGATAAGGTWAYANRDRLMAFVQPPVPVAVTCPEGMIGFAEGAFMQGSNKLDPDRDITEILSRDVTVKSFCIDRYEYPNEVGEAPLTGVTFAQAVESCATQNKRLCNEPEWERACKGATGSRYPYGDRFEPGICNVASTDTPGKPQKAGAFDKCGDAKGPRDLSGNVWEMTASAWPEDPDMRVIKGGSAKLPAWGARCAYRDAIELAVSGDDIGFRCCK